MLAPCPGNRGDAEFRRHSDASGRRCSRHAELRLASVAFLLLPGSSPLALVRVKNGLPAVDPPCRPAVRTGRVIPRWTRLVFPRSGRDPSTSSRGGPAALSRGGPAESSSCPEGTLSRRPAVRSGPAASSRVPRGSSASPRGPQGALPLCSAVDPPRCPAVPPVTRPCCTAVGMGCVSVVPRSGRDPSASSSCPDGTCLCCPAVDPSHRPAVRTELVRVVPRWTRRVVPQWTSRVVPRFGRGASALSLRPDGTLPHRPAVDLPLRPEVRTRRVPSEQRDDRDRSSPADATSLLHRIQD